jgi:roadblock/LC7 domain-containing protein
MAFTQENLAAVDAAIASGELTVRDGDGRLVTYRDLDQLIKARALIVADLSSQAGAAGGTVRAYPRHQLADFSD